MTFDLGNGEIVDLRALFADDERDRSAILATVFAGQVERARRVKAGLVQPEVRHVIAACAEIVAVPYGRLRPFAAPGGLLSRALR